MYRLVFIVLIIRIGEKFQHIVERSPPLTSGNLYELNQFFECLRGCEAIAVESEMELFWQHSTRLHRIGTHHLQQQALDTDAVILKLLWIAQQQFFCDATEQIINPMGLVFGWH